ncbi:DUF5666 domain-containing protein [Luteimonas sp. e5]
MNVKTLVSSASMIAASLLLAGCVGMGGGYPGSGYPGPGYPDGSGYPGQGYPPPTGQGQAIVGDVDGVDHANGRFMLRSDGGYGGYGQRVEINYDRNTVLYYQGQQLSPSGLENGDRIQVQAVQSGGRWWARSIEVLRDVRSGGVPGGGYGYPSGPSGAITAMSGAVSFIDARNRLLHFTSGGYSGSTQRVRYDERTWVDYRGQRWSVDSLQRGDTVRIDARAMGNGEYLAERIMLDVRARDR